MLHIVDFWRLILFDFRKNLKWVWFLKSFQVCELHFQAEDIRSESSAFVTVEVKLQKTYPRDGVIPRILPNAFYMKQHQILYPKINQSLVIESDFAVHVFCGYVEINEIGDYKIPKPVTDQNSLEIQIENVKKMDTEQQQIEHQNMIFILKSVMSFLLLLQEELNKHFNSIKSIYEQLKLMTQSKFDYSIEIIFSSLLYDCSPKGYRLLRDSKNIILPSYSTITRLTLSTYMNPLIEQHDNNFLMYIKNKFKLLVSRTPQNLDEIHIKDYIDYKGGLYCWLIWQQ